MTWVIGVNSMFGIAILVSDVCVTFTLPSGEKRYLDCLQKIYPLGRCVIGGFSGSVRIGFRMMEYLRRQFEICPENSRWDLDMISNTWLPRVVRRIFNLSPENEKKYGCSIILAGAHPTKNRGDLAVPWTDVVRLRSPDFKPEKVEQRNIISIGKGSVIDDYVDRVQRACNDFAFHEVIMGGKAAQANYVVSTVEKAVQENPISGVSKFFQYAWVNREEYSIINHEYDIYPPNEEKIEVRCPEIAKGYQKFIQLSKELGVQAESSVC